MKMFSAGGHVPTHTRRAGLGQRLRDRESKSAVVRDPGDEGASSRQVDVEHAVV